MKTKFYCLAAIAVASVGVLFTSCETTGEEKIVEKEVLVADNSDAAMMGLLGNPKSILEEYSSKATVTGSTVDLGETISAKSKMEFNATRGLTSKISYTFLLSDAMIDKDGWMILSNPKEKPLTTITNTFDAEGRLTKIESVENTYRFFVNGTMIPSYAIDGNQIDPMHFEDLGITVFEPVEWRATSQVKVVTTIDLTAKKATRISSSLEGENWVESKKEVLDLDANGLPNESSKEVFESKAFADTPATKLVEKKDAKGNWILRYTAEADGEGGFINSLVTKRTIVYY